MATLTVSGTASLMGNLKATYGTFTSTIGDSSATVVLPGSSVLAVNFVNPVAGGTPFQPALQVALNLATMTMTVYFNETQTAGTFFIITQ